MYRQQLARATIHVCFQRAASCQVAAQKKETAPRRLPRVYRLLSTLLTNRMRSKQHYLLRVNVSSMYLC